jgi:exodeoxyribonuclease V
MTNSNPFRPTKVAQPDLTESEAQQPIAAVLAWLKRPSKPVFRLYGPAGTGKTTLAKQIASKVNGQVCFAAFSGKAASVLRQKGCADATTIHNLIYTPSPQKGKLEFVLNEQSRLQVAQLAIIDEASMVDQRLGRDLLSYNRPVLVLGDPAQLPPIEGRGFFTQEKKPDILLKDILRQHKDSPIIKLATQAREGKSVSISEDNGSFVRKKLDVDIDTFLQADQILVGTNDTRHRFNLRVRELRGLPLGKPQPNDKLVCLKNNASKNIFNGEIWFVTEVLGPSDDIIRLKLRPETGERSDVTVNVRREYFEQADPKLPEKALKDLDRFTFAYALTVHKAQGSEWPSVVLFDESDQFGDNNAKWLYTGITRASQSIKIYV